jgi:hypothetical protein
VVAQGILAVLAILVLLPLLRLLTVNRLPLAEVIQFLLVAQEVKLSFYGIRSK